jgi:RHS repeat-associated protein
MRGRRAKIVGRSTNVSVSSWRLSAVCLLSCLLGAVPSVALAHGTAASEGAAASLRASLVSPAVEALAGGGRSAAAEAVRDTPTAIAQRALSRTRFEHLGRKEAAALAEKTFGIEDPSWTAPDSAGEGHITKYVSQNVASEVSSSGQHLALASTVPLRSAVGTGRMAPTSLELQTRGAAFVPANPTVPVSMSKAPSSGTSLPFGISVAPAQAASPEESMVVGNRVVYPDTAPATDFMAEPVPVGVELSWQLLGEESSPENALQFSLPAGAVLQMSKTEPGVAEIVKEGQTLNVIEPAKGIEADGTILPVSYTINGSTLVTHVDLSGSVAFPVVVDPTIAGILEGKYGNYGAGTWGNWLSEDNCGTGCYGLFASASQLIAIIANAPWPAGYEGNWYVLAPGTGEPEGAGITRVDLDGVSHNSEQSMMREEILESNGTDPGWTFNGGEPIKPEDEGGYESPAVVSNMGMALCAQVGGGIDEQLCNYEDSGGEFRLSNEVLGWTSVYNFTEITGAVIRYRDKYAPYEVWFNGPAAKGYWINGTPNGNEKIGGADHGVGVASLDIEIPPGHENEAGQPAWADQIACPYTQYEICPHFISSGTIEWPAMSTGEHKIGVYAIDAAENVRELQPAPTIYFDKTPPKVTLSGSLEEHSNGQIAETGYALNVATEDGSASAPQSGVEEIEIHVDGKWADKVQSKCADPVGVPKTECFDLSTSWTLEGQQYGVGTHTVEVIVKDWAGNKTTETFQVTVHAAASQAVGPGTVNLKTGNLHLEATDVDIAAANGQLDVGREYDSREPTQGTGGPLGPQWTLNLPDAPADGIWKSLRALPNGGVQATLGTGLQVTFQPSGSGYTSPDGFQTDALKEISSSPLEYTITDTSGDTTTFRRASSEKEEAPLLVPVIVSQAAGLGGLNKMTYVYATEEGITEPKEVIAPYPSTLNCTVELVKGCRALELRYATATTSEGEGETQWKEYRHRLAEIKLVAWNGKEMAKVAVAQYAWDLQGRLRAEWDPQISPALKTIYGYETESHITSVTAPGMETWALTYGTIAGEPNTGRLLKALQAPPATALWAGENLANSEKPVLSGSPDVGVRMAVSQGKWTGSPVAYSYSWKACPPGGGECTTILGADNPNYTPTTSQVGYMLIAQVMATNGGGSVTAVTTASATVGTAKGTEAAQVAPAPGTTIEYGVPTAVTGRQSMTKEEVAKWDQGPDVPVEGTAIFPPDEPESWPAGDYKRATIYYLDAEAYAVDIANPAGGIAVAEYESQGNTVRTLSADNLATALKAGTKSAEAAKPLYTEDHYAASSTELSETLGPEHLVKLPGGSEPVEARKQVKYSYEEGAPPGEGLFRLVTSTTEDALVAGKEEDKRTVKNSYAGQENLGWKLHEPTSTTTAAGSLATVHSSLYSSNTGATTETAMPGAAAKELVFPSFSRQLGNTGTESEKLYHPSGIAIDAAGDEWVTSREKNRVEEISPTGAFIKDFGTSGSGSDQFDAPEGIAFDPTTKDFYIADTLNNRIDELNEKGEFVKAFGFGVNNGEAKLETCTTSCKAGIAGGAAGQLDEPQDIGFGSGGNLWITDSANNRIDSFTESGEFIVTLGWGVKSSKGKFQACTSGCLAGAAGSGAGQMSDPASLVVTGTTIYVTDHNNDRVDEFNTSREYVTTFGEKGTGNGDFNAPTGIAAGLGGDILVVDSENGRVEKFSTAGSYISQFATKGTGAGQLGIAEGLEVSASEQIYVADSTNNRVSEWVPSLTGNTGAYSTQTIYYTPGTEATVGTCQNHPEWANMPCETRPAHQPEVAGTSPLSITTYTYNIYFEPEVTKTTVGEGSEEATRTETDTHDAAGRLTAKEITSSTGTTLPKVSYGFSTTTGLPIKLSTGTGSGEQKITQEFNRVGALASYVDAAGKTTTYEYEKEKDERLIKVTDEKGNQTLGYNETTGALTSLKDSSGATFTATYDPEENLATETIAPAGLTASTTRNAVGEPVALKYVKETHCTEKCEWYFDDVTPSIHGQWLSQSSSLGKDSYSFNEAGWITEAQETPAGKTCPATRSYAYDADQNRTSLTKRPAGTGSPCSTPEAEVEEHQYDTADRSLDAGLTANPFGDVTVMPAGDAGGAALKSSFYADGQLATQEQSGQTISYSLDPARRAGETIATGKSTSTVTDQYDGPGATPSWLAYSSGEWTRNIHGISGALVATQKGTETPTLQLANLHGDIIGTMLNSETATKATLTSEATEYGVPTGTEAAPLSWLGTSAIRTELPSGAINLGARSYVPQAGRFLQPDPRPGGSGNAYVYSHGDPLNESDPSGELSLNSTSGGLSAVGEGEGVELQGGVGIGSDSVLPPPPDVQAEEAFEAAVVRYQDEPAAGTEEVTAAEEWDEEVSGEAGGFISGRGGFGRFGELYFSEDNNPDVESKCNKTGQSCPGKRGGGGSHGSGHVTVRDVVCTIVGAIGGALGDVPGALGAGGGCIVIWP